MRRYAINAFKKYQYGCSSVTHSNLHNGLKVSCISLLLQPCVRAPLLWLVLTVATKIPRIAPSADVLKVTVAHCAQKQHRDPQVTSLISLQVGGSKRLPFSLHS